MNLGDTFITIFVILLAACLFFIFPLSLTANENDSAAQISLQTSMTDFVNEICSTGKITKRNYDKFIEIITSPNVYDIKIEVKVLDENPSKKITVNNPTQIGENVFVTYYTSQIVQQLDEKGSILLKEGDQVHVAIANINTTLAQHLSLARGNAISTITAETTQACMVNGI